MMIKKWMVIGWLALIFSGVGVLFYYNEWIFKAGFIKSSDSQRKSFFQHGSIIFTPCFQI